MFFVFGCRHSLIQSSSEATPPLRRETYMSCAIRTAHKRYQSSLHVIMHNINAREKKTKTNSVLILKNIYSPQEFPSVARHRRGTPSTARGSNRLSRPRHAQMRAQAGPEIRNRVFAYVRRRILCR